MKIEPWFYDNCADCIYYRYIEIGKGKCVFEVPHEFVDASNVCKEFTNKQPIEGIHETNKA